MPLNRPLLAAASFAFIGLASQVLTQGLTPRASAGDFPTKRHADHTVSRLEPLIETLDSDSYPARKRASKQLIEIAQSPEQTAQVRAALIETTKIGSIEQRVASRRLLAEIEQQTSRRDPIPDSFRELAGTDRSAEQLYHRMSDRFGRWITMAESDQLSVNTWCESFSLSQLSPEDHEAWATVLYLEILLDGGPSDDARSPKVGDAFKSTPLSQASLSRHSKIRMILSHPAMGPLFSDHSQPFGDQLVLGRLIESYLRLGRKPADRSLVLAACRYGRIDFLVEQSQQWIQRDDVSASSLVTAMLALLAVDPDRLDGHLNRLAGDNRVAHVWQSVDSGPEKIETRVSDVAEVISLHLRGLDPRDHGFKYLRADPWLVYAPYSLGSVKRLGRNTK